MKKLTEQEKEELIIKELTQLDNLLELLYRHDVNGMPVTATPQYNELPYENRNFGMLISDGLAFKTKNISRYHIHHKGRIKFLKGGYLGEYDKLKAEEKYDHSHKNLIDNASRAAIGLVILAALTFIVDNTNHFNCFFCACCNH